MSIKIEDFNSAGIRAYARDIGAQTMERTASFGSFDARVTFYRLDTGELVADTNGDPLLGEEAEAALADYRAIEAMGEVQTEDHWDEQQAG